MHIPPEGLGQSLHRPVQGNPGLTPEETSFDDETSEEQPRTAIGPSRINIEAGTSADISFKKS